MKFISLQIFSKGNNGLRSDKLYFGKNITQLYGKNGCGKTPIIQSILYCLGYQTTFRQDIYDYCNYANLSIIIGDNELQIKRRFDKSDFHIKILDHNFNEYEFFNEESFSLFFFEKLDLKRSSLVTNQKKKTHAYISHLLPLSYLDQDEGYTKYYYAPTNYIKDQSSEIIRTVFNFPSKNNFESKKEKIKAQDLLEYCDKVVDKSKRELEIAKANTEKSNKDSEDINRSISILKVELEKLRNDHAGQNDSINSIDVLISNIKRMIDDNTSTIYEIEKRRKSKQKIIEEIEAEIQTLSLNEKSRRVFKAFQEICPSQNCHLFSNSSAQYSKNLLYLKDQIKDLDRNEKHDQTVIIKLNEDNRLKQMEIDELILKRNSAIEHSELDVYTEAISDLKSQIFDLQSELSDIKHLEKLTEKLFNNTVKRNDALDKYNSFDKTTSKLPELIKLKSDLKEIFIKWLEIINIQNVSLDITLEDDFIPVLGRERLNHLKGSTKTRAVLAYHATLIELMALRKISPLKFLILDTPKQQEAQVSDIDEYIKALKVLAKEYDIQIIFSTTEYHYDGDSDDIEWNPLYDGEKQKMFLERVNR